MPEVQEIELGRLDENPFNPRREFGDIGELARIQREQGFDQVFTARVHPKQKGRFEVCKHSRSLRAALLNVKQAQFPKNMKVPVIVKALDDAEMEYQAFMDNWVTKDLTVMETAHYLKRRADYHKESLLKLLKSKPQTAEIRGAQKTEGFSEVAKEIGQTTAWVSMMVKLTELNPKVQGLVAQEFGARLRDTDEDGNPIPLKDRRLPWTTALELAKADLTPDEQVKWANYALENVLASRKISPTAPDGLREKIAQAKGKAEAKAVRKIKEKITAEAPAMEVDVGDLSKPEELEEAAEILKKKARAAKTPEQKAAEKKEKEENRALKAAARVEKLYGEVEAVLEKAAIGGVDDTPGLASEAKAIHAGVKKDPVGTAKALQEWREKVEGLRTKAQAKKEATEELLGDAKFIKQAAKAAPELPEEAPKPIALQIPTLSEKDVAELRKSFEEQETRLKAIKESPQYKALRNWEAHQIVIAMVGEEMKCPVCGKRKLHWACHNLALEAAEAKLSKEVEQ